MICIGSISTDAAFFSLFKFVAKSKEITCLEDTVAALKEDYERSLSANVASKKDLQENLISAKHELLRVQEQLALAEKVHHRGLCLQLTTALACLNQDLAKCDSHRVCLRF